MSERIPRPMPRKLPGVRMECLGPDFVLFIHSRLTDSKHWTTVQVVVPIIVGLSLTAAFVTVFLLYRRSHSTEPLFRDRGMFGLFPRQGRVRHRKGVQGPWSID